jgi:hypothetical protein
MAWSPGSEYLKVSYTTLEVSMKNSPGRFLRPFAIIISCITVLAFAIPALATRDFTAKTDRASYPVKSTVTIKIKNTGTESLHLAGTNLAAIVDVAEAEGWREVYTWPQKPSGVPDDLAPGGTASWTWNTKDNEGKFQPVGKYRVEVHITTPRYGYEVSEFTQPFTLTAASGEAETKKISHASATVLPHPLAVLCLWWPTAPAACEPRFIYRDSSGYDVPSRLEASSRNAMKSYWRYL